MRERTACSACSLRCMQSFGSNTEAGRQPCRLLHAPVQAPHAYLPQAAKPVLLFSVAVKIGGRHCLAGHSACRQTPSRFCRGSPQCPTWPSPRDCPPHTLSPCTAPVCLHGTEHAAVTQCVCTLQLPSSCCSRLHAWAQHVAVPDRGRRQQRSASVTSCHTPTRLQGPGKQQSSRLLRPCSCLAASTAQVDIKGAESLLGLCGRASEVSCSAEPAGDALNLQQGTETGATAH